MQPIRYGLDYLRRGWSVVPLAARSKRPLVPWERLQTHPPTEKEIADWARHWPSANIGIVTGAVSKLVVLDIDPGHGGNESVAVMQRQHGDLPRTPQVATGGGGAHIYFRHPGEPIANRAGIAPGVDLRGDGGLVVAPPSVHPSGRTYVWRPSLDPDSCALAPVPLWLLLDNTVAPRHGHPVTYWRALLAKGVEEGRRNDTIASLAGHLLWHGVDPRVATELLLCWNEVRCRPSLAPEEVTRTVQSVRRTQERHRSK